MDNYTFGLTVTIIGMGCTLAVLWFVSFLVILLRKAFPPEGNSGKSK